MNFSLSTSMQAIREEAARFTATEITPFADSWDEAGRIPQSVIAKLGEAGYMGACIAPEFGGMGLGQLEYGLVTEEIGFGCSSVRSLLTVHLSLVAETIQRWGNDSQQQKWLPQLANGSKLAAFALSEPETGSDALGIKTSCSATENGFILSGTKKWITFGQIADVLLVAAKSDEGISTFLVETSHPGVEIVPINGMLGTRASMLAKIRFNNCEIPTENLLGVRNMGFMQIVNTALDNGRFSVACGTLGLLRACLAAGISYAKQREQFGQKIADFQLIRQKITRMTADAKAARLLCYNAGYLRDQSHPDSIPQTSLAKYFTADAARNAARETLQIHGAAGMLPSHPAQRFYRDSMVMTIIEGTQEIHEVTLAEEALRNTGTFLD